MNAEAKKIIKRIEKLEAEILKVAEDIEKHDAESDAASTIFQSLGFAGDELASARVTIEDELEWAQ